jgi:N-acetylneuraminic acid mutarotase
MIIWGGGGPTFDTNTGGRYNPATNTWTATSTTNAPSARNWSSYVWTGSKMLIWGGQTYDGSYTYHNDGGQYDPSTNSWTKTTLAGAPSPRGWFGYVWTGSDLIVWSGCGANGGFCSGSVVTGGRYNPSSDLWTPVPNALNRGEVIRNVAIGLEANPVEFPIKSQQVAQLILNHNFATFDNCHSIGKHLNLRKHV